MSLRTISVMTGERFNEFDDLVRSLLERNEGGLQGASLGGGRRDYYVDIEEQNYKQVLKELREAGVSLVEQDQETDG